MYKIPRLCASANSVQLANNTFTEPPITLHPPTPRNTNPPSQTEAPPASYHPVPTPPVTLTPRPLAD